MPQVHIATTLLLLWSLFKFQPISLIMTAKLSLPSFYICDIQIVYDQIKPKLIRGFFFGRPTRYYLGRDLGNFHLPILWHVFHLTFVVALCLHQLYELRYMVLASVCSAFLDALEIFYHTEEQVLWLEIIYYWCGDHAILYVVPSQFFYGNL